jgi:hypothetical protein
VFGVVKPCQRDVGERCPVSVEGVGPHRRHSAVRETGKCYSTEMIILLKVSIVGSSLDGKIGADLDGKAQLYSVRKRCSGHRHAFCRCDSGC